MDFPSISPMMQARTEAVIELSYALIETIDKVMTVHGKDPANISIVAAGFARTIDYMNYIDPEFRETMVQLLSNEVLNREADRVMKKRMNEAKNYYDKGDKQ